MGLADVTPAPPVADPSPAGPNGRRTEGILALLFGGFTAVIGCVLLLGGVALVLTHALARDRDGYYASGSTRLSTATYAITSSDIAVGTLPAHVLPEDVLGPVRPGVARPGGAPVFVGIGPAREVNSYLRGVAHAEVDDITGDPPRYVTRVGGWPRGLPGAERFWVASSQGTGRQTNLVEGQERPLGGRSDGLRRHPTSRSRRQCGHQDRVVPGSRDRTARAWQPARGGSDRADLRRARPAARAISDMTEHDAGDSATAVSPARATVGEPRPGQPNGMPGAREDDACAMRGRSRPPRPGEATNEPIPAGVPA
jgi:hypothetical protein